MWYTFYLEGTPSLLCSLSICAVDSSLDAPPLKFFPDLTHLGSSLCVSSAPRDCSEQGSHPTLYSDCLFTFLSLPLEYKQELGLNISLSQHSA